MKKWMSNSMKYLQLSSSTQIGTGTGVEIKKALEQNIKTPAEKADMSQFKANRLEKIKWKFEGKAEISEISKFLL